LSRKIFLNAALIIFLLVPGCTRSAAGPQAWRVAPKREQTAVQQRAATPEPVFPTTRARRPGEPVLSPTPDPARVLPTPRLDEEQYVVQPNDTLGIIAQRYGVSLEKLIEANTVSNPDILEVGQALTIPAPDPLPPGPDFKIIPDSELVYSPSNASFDLEGFISQQDGYLNRYTQEVDDRIYTGAQIVRRVAYENSVNPRLLLAVLEYRSGWVTRSNPPEESRDYPLLYFNNTRKGLYRQLSWTANTLDYGYYLWRVNALPSMILQDGGVVPLAGTLNAGTAGVQYLLGQFFGRDDWLSATGQDGVYATFYAMFGYPFDYTYEPLLPPDLQQPPMQLPFEPGDVWAFTGGPHVGWANGSGWAALDFAPPGPPLGCVLNEAWMVAVADGLVIRSDNGAVVQDLDGDGLEQTGWTVLYLHVDSSERVQPGTYLRAGERIGHASCEGGVSNGTHLHLARRYNGEWIPADGPLPFNLDGWISQGAGSEYDGYLVKDGVWIEAWGGGRGDNQINR
jgi:LysM repeat protein